MEEERVLTLIWHGADEEPYKDGFLLVEKMLDDCGSIYEVVAMEWIKDTSACWGDYVYIADLIRWCYISDLEIL